MSYRVFAYNRPLLKVLKQLIPVVIENVVEEFADCLLAGLIDADGTIYLRDKKLQIHAGALEKEALFWKQFLIQNYSAKPFVTFDDNNFRVRVRSAITVFERIAEFVRHLEKKQKIKHILSSAAMVTRKT